MLTLQGVSKSFAGQTVLQPLDLVVENGQSLVLLGPSGCGKSTLLRIMAGLLLPDTGSVALDGEPLTNENAETMRRKMGFVLQDGGLFPHLTLRQNVTLLAKYLGKASDWIAKRTNELAALTDIAPEMLDRYPLQASGGQRQRVAIMRALMLDPPILLLDEPMGALDPVVRYDLQEDLKQIITSLNKTSIMVTHDMGEAQFFGDKVVMMGRGRVLQQGSFRDLITSPASEDVAQFIKAQRHYTVEEGDVRA